MSLRSALYAFARLLGDATDSVAGYLERLNDKMEDLIKAVKAVEEAVIAYAPSD